MWAAVPLAISIVGIIGLISLKGAELHRGKAFFGGLRARLDARAEHLFMRISGDVPHRGKALISYAAHQLAVHISAFALLVIRFAERKLTRFVDMVKGRHELKNGNLTNSTYLRDVTSHRDEVRRVNGYHDKK